MRTLDLVPEDFAILRVVLEQVVDNKLLWRLAHPLEEGEVSELVGLEHLEHLNRLVANVLDEVTHISWDNAHIAGHVVECPSGALGCEDGYSASTPNEKVPLVRIGVPVHLPDGAGLDGDVRSCYGLGDGEVLRVSNPNLAAAGDLGILLEHAVAEVVL